MDEKYCRRYLEKSLLIFVYNTGMGEDFMKVDEKIAKLRNLMKQKNIDIYVIPSSDSHQSEYTTEHFKSREWISGFTGSAGTVVVTMNRTVLFTDGRYFLQAEEELKGTGVELFKMAESGVLTLEEFLDSELDQGQTLGFDGKLFSHIQVEKMKSALKNKDILIDADFDLVDEIWTDRPELPTGEVFVHNTEFSGKSVTEKLKLIKDEMNKKNADYYLLNCLDAIAWTFDIRGSDIPYNPFVISYALIGQQDTRLFIDSDKLNQDTIEYLTKENVEICSYSAIEQTLKDIESDKSILLDPTKISNWCFKSISLAVKKILSEDIVENLKAIKNEVEIKNFEKCQIRDGVAMVKFLYWLDENLGKEKITEISASDKLEQIRSEGENYVSLSFETISGYKDHAAIVHYSAKKDTEYELKSEGMLLVDSGAQYLDGTTDITRTIVLGEVTDEEKRDFTLVLKGHIALSKAKFTYGTTGTQLDVLARMPLWKEGKDFKHGTGHGIGYLLSVHEGPQRISPMYSKVKLEDGMLITNEPGFYKDGEYGIRTENILLVREDYENEFGQFMKFETTTLCPINTRGIEEELLSDGEKKWLNDYHEDVYKALHPYLNREEQNWLKTQTREL